MKKYLQIFGLSLAAFIHTACMHTPDPDDRYVYSTNSIPDSWVKTNAVVTLSCDFTNQENKRSELYSFWNIHNRLDPYKHLGYPADRENAKINCIRVLGGWKTKDPSIDAYQWDGTNYVYRFDLVKERIDFVRSKGMPIYQIVLDNVPWAFQRGIEFTEEPDGEHYLAEHQYAQYGNAIPPNDYEAWAAFIRALMQELIDTYGKEQVEQWRFRVGTEFDTYPGHWAGTKDELLYHYKMTTDAVREVLPTAKVGIHIREAGFVKKNTVDYKGTQIQSIGTDFVEFCKANDAHYDFVGITFYPMPNQKNRANVDTIYEKDIKPIKEHPDWNPDAIFEIHEYMMLTSTANHIFTGFGTSHGAAYFGLVAEMMYKYDIRQVFQWGNVVRGLYKPEVLTTSILETMVGKVRYGHQKSGSTAVKGNIIGAIFAAGEKGKAYDAFVYNYHMKSAYHEDEKVNISMTLPHKSGTKYRFRYAYYGQEQNSFQRFVADHPEAGKSIDEGGWVKNGSNKNGEPQLILGEEGMKVYRQTASEYLKYNEVQWSDWQLGETVAGEARKQSKIQFGAALPSFALKKFEIEIID